MLAKEIKLISRCGLCGARVYDVTHFTHCHRCGEVAPLEGIAVGDRVNLKFGFSCLGNVTRITNDGYLSVELVECPALENEEDVRVDLDRVRWVDLEAKHQSDMTLKLLGLKREEL